MTTPDPDGPENTNTDGGSDDVRLRVATAADATLLANLLELYIHELSDVFPGLHLGSDGRFGYPKLPSFFETEGRFPFLIERDGRLAGFALVTRGSPISDDPTVFDVAEFFVLRGERAGNVGRRAAELLWRRFPATWTVRVAEANRGAVAFWSAVVLRFAGGATVEVRRAGDHRGMGWRIFTFHSAARDIPEGEPQKFD
jgi:predicted acetyltransferase